MIPAACGGPRRITPPNQAKNGKKRGYMIRGRLLIVSTDASVAAEGA
jgi:hypothetical protein